MVITIRKNLDHLIINLVIKKSEKLTLSQLEQYLSNAA